MTKYEGAAMTGHVDDDNTRTGSRWRLAGWSAAGLILLLPLVAMQFTDSVNWSGADFAFASVLLIGTGITFELAVRRTGDTAYRAAVGVALGAAFLLIWLNAAVGLIGSEDHPANVMYGGVLAVGIIGAVIARFRPRGMARALVATALAQVLVAAIALVGGFGMPESPPAEILGLNAFFVALFAVSAWLFWKAARQQPSAGAGG